MRKPKKLFKALGILGALLIFAPQISANAAPSYAGTDNTNVWYKAHVQDIGWQNTVVNGDTAGTTGRALKIEALQIDVSDSASFSIEYNAYVNTIGWVGVQKDGQTIGTTGRNLPMYGICIAIKDKNTKQDSANYDIYYRVHVRDIGWESWTKNGNLAGDTANGKPIEAIEIQIRPKGEGPITGGQTQADKVVNEALYWVGKIRYQSPSSYNWQTGVLDKNNPPASMDCSDFTSAVYATALGIRFQDWTGSQMSVGTGIAKEGPKVGNYSNLVPGDLIIFAWPGGNNATGDHVAIYIGNGQIVHESGTNAGGNVKINSLNEYWTDYGYVRSNIISIRRVI